MQDVGGVGGVDGRGRETFYKDYLLVLLLLSCSESLYPSLAPSVEVVEGRQFFTCNGIFQVMSYPIDLKVHLTVVCRVSTMHIAHMVRNKGCSYHFLT